MADVRLSISVDEENPVESPAHLHVSGTRGRARCLLQDRCWDGNESSALYCAASGSASDSHPSLVRLELPSHYRHEGALPPERAKTLLSFFFLCVASTLNMVSLAVVHDKVPDRSRYGPLPDVVLDNISTVDWALDVSEYLILVLVYLCLAVVALHRYRWILLRRLLFLLGLLYLMRTVTMFVTVLPVASLTYYCEPKANVTTLAIVAHRVMNLVSGLGLSINGRHVYCGDYIFSGHTMVLTLACLMIQEYSPKRFILLHWAAWALGVVGVCLLLVARGHYTVDVVIAYYVTTRVFWMYHTMANNKAGDHGHLSRVWWFLLFAYFEENVKKVVPRQYQCPLPDFCWCRRRNSGHDF